MEFDRPWPKPHSRSFAALSDCGLYAEVLQVARKERTISPAKLMSEDQGLRQRMRRLHLVQFPTKTNLTALLHALQAFDWLKEERGAKGQFSLTPQGERVAAESGEKPREFRRQLASKLQERYVIPGWFVSRLHTLNPKGQGEVVLPALLKNKKIERRLWSQRDWSSSFDRLVVDAAIRANDVFPGSFPVALDVWLHEVKKRWERLGSGNPPVSRSATQKQKEAPTFAPRERLVHAMREAAVDLLFGVQAPGASKPDFANYKPPIPSRAFSVWCPRLEELEFVFYTDYHQIVPGRVLVPCAAFRKFATTPPFECLESVRDPQGRCLWLYQPSWENVRDTFWDVLQDSYRRTSKSVGAMYVSLLNVRDEVCRQLRLSSNRFDTLLECAYRESIQGSVTVNKFVSISLESDFTPDQKGAVGLNRRPVYINNIPHSLIAIATNRNR